MKVHLFRVEPQEDTAPLKDVLSLIVEDSLRDRIRLVNSVEMRADHIGPDEHGLWFIDFVRIRTSNGPGKVGRDTETTGFEFGDEQGFGEETAALFDPETGYMLLQYNHHGVRFGSIADYFSFYDQTSNNIYTLAPKFDEDVERRLNRQGITKKLSFAIDMGHISRDDMKRGTALSEVLEYGAKNGAKTIRIEISAGSQKGKGLIDRGLGSIQQLLGKLGTDPDAVTTMKVTGKEDPVSKSEILDLLGHRLCTEFTDLPLGDDLRYAQEDRYKALLRAKAGWAKFMR